MSATADNEINAAPKTPTVDISDSPDNVKDSPGSSKKNVNVEVRAVPDEERLPLPSPHGSSFLGDEKRESRWRESRWELEKRNSQWISEDALDPEAGIDWKPGFINQFPWIGFAGLITLIVSTAAAVAILALSDKRRVEDWPFRKLPIQPNVLLNIANQVQNLGLLTMIGQGLAIAWWRKAMDGASLRTLHMDHAYSTSVYSILTSGKRFNFIALAALMTKFAVIDSTLFQKATRTHITQQKAYMNTSVTGWVETNWVAHSGGIPGDEGNIKTIDAPWADVLEAYNGKIANGKMHDSLAGNASFFDCPYRQECSGFIKGLGFGFNCSTTVEDVDYGAQQQTARGGVQSSYPLWDVSFNTSFSSATKSYASVTMSMVYVDTHAGDSKDSCPGTRTTRTCDIRPALVEYPVTIMTPSKEELEGKNIVVHVKFFEDNAIWPLSASLDNVEQIDQLKLMNYVDLDEHYNETSTIGALTYVLNNLYRSSANLTYTSDWDVQARGSLAQSTYYAESSKDSASRCWYDIDRTGKDDPAVEMLRRINTLSFVAGLYLNQAPSIDVKDRPARGLPSQTIQTSVTGIVEEYITQFAYVGGALGATFLTLLLVLPVYWGFWQLGRKVTLGPLEISNAFGAPIIAPDRTKAYHGDFDQVLEDVGKRRVKYGQLKNAPQGQMGIAEPDKVLEPAKTHRIHSGQDANRKIGVGAALGAITAAAIGGGGHAHK
ncbi:hypothetical protein ACN47E_008022 [Coniothyrium glycines]